MFEIVVLSGCMLSLVLYIARLVISLQTMKRFRDNRTIFHNFQTAAGMDEVGEVQLAITDWVCKIILINLVQFDREQQLTVNIFNMS